MLEFIIAIRNIIIALLLSWIGITFSAPTQDTIPDTDTPEDTRPIDTDTLLRLG